MKSDQVIPVPSTRTEKLTDYATKGMQLFLIGMVGQFLAHTILTYGLNLPSALSFIRVWKEVFVII